MNSISPKLILGIETATLNCSVGLVQGAKIIGQKNVMNRAVHSEKLIELVDDVLKPDFAFADVDAIAISIGPGSYTGLRIGLATAKGLAFDKQLPILPVPTLTALEVSARREVIGGAVFFIKSHRDLVYYTVAGGNEPLILKRKIAYAPIGTVAELYPEHLLVGDNAFDGQFGNRLTVCFPAGDIVAQLGADYFEDLLPLSRPDLEPDYHSNLEARVWPLK
ncbi:MAG TPA: tRNA (adenosine(37)-N6)-threonylcarbamoyltransferase complex dimerization subunit type 1 TsaB [Candidatus Marinimicrobia bacterium]|nr:tRNA (adenosine(37)-N6)-threonylcarbamoyltransferase complex dimerization subunit type 1 TsaB [Candidatus Neomarinimicrobiota bacterium]HRS52578.1 tRNA (adenosine(37)-N6)-threonylcarbamoyltransferase complex dimerization subunit type 1 TsaB [Candidatus Neomarinimicrobiota bacterium]HRU93172.1 tRNA (adenosine(37)-N6)-threonylcarbamoyltransferase complex dimerization subunit type 1 TsaB [Candidatus Neomarinimicrobiota bacterium]